MLVAVAGLPGCASPEPAGEDEHCCAGSMWRMEREPPTGYFDIDWAHVPPESRMAGLEDLFDLALNHTPLTSGDPLAEGWGAEQIAGGLWDAYEAQNVTHQEWQGTGSPPPGYYSHDAYDATWRILYEGKGLAFEWSTFTG